MTPDCSGAALDAALPELLGTSRPMRELLALVRQIAPYASTVLVTGETGSGKELVARALHRLGPRAGRALVAVNCSAIVETLFESELFGHVRGAFTGATEHRIGLMERAHGGTLLLDEIGELSPAMQAKLLRVLETGEVTRVGATDSRRFDVHVVAATNRDLAATRGRAASEAISSTGSTSWMSTCRPCVTDPATSGCWRTRLRGRRRPVLADP